MLLLDSSYWTIRQTPKKGRGIFAQREINGGCVVGDYIGRILPDTEAEEKEAAIGLYSMTYGSGSSIFPEDTAAPGVHLINHSCMPNCNTYPFRNHTLYFAIRNIFPGEELTVAYDMEYSDRPSPGSYACFCGTLLCRGTMCVSAEMQSEAEAFAEKIQRRWIDESRDIHTVLTAFSDYPSSVPDHDIYDMFANTEKTPLVLQDTTIPDIHHIRRMLRTRGVPIRFARIGIDIIGIYRSTVLVRKITGEHV